MWKSGRQQGLAGWAAVVALLLASTPGTRGAENDPKDTQRVANAVVKLFVTANLPSYYTPWTSGLVLTYQGSGAVLADHRILTCAHVVSFSTVLRAQRDSHPKKYEARVLAISHETDLALLTVDDPSFFSGIDPLSLGSLPTKQEEVLVLGFPTGGDALSITKGVVSRVEHQLYVHSWAELLAVQIDAAVNPGNSGGPVVSGGKLEALAMQADGTAQNTNYGVPSTIIRHFLTDLADGRLDGVPVLGIRTQKLESPTLKQKLGLPAGRTGVRVTAVSPLSAATGVLRADDVVLSIGGRGVADDGTIEFRPHERTQFSLAAQELQIGSRLPLEIWRQGESRAVEVTLDQPWPASDLVRAPENTRLPRYFIFGGIAFAPYDTNYSWLYGQAGPPNALRALADRFASAPDEEPVLISKVFSDRVNQGYDWAENLLVATVDGEHPRNLADLVRLVENGAGPFVTFADTSGQQIVIDRAQARASGANILATYKIPADRSAELAPRLYRQPPEGERDMRAVARH
jgi:S1-C subfamily serine protease